MKKFLAMALALCMIFALCACGNSAPAAAPAAAAPASNEAAPAAAAEAAPEVKPFRIGFYGYAHEGATITPQINGIEAVCKAFGGEAVTTLSTANNTSAFLEATETLLSMDVDAVVLNFAHLGYSTIPLIQQMCDEAEVYYSFFYCYENIPDEYQKLLDNSPYYIGRSYSPEYGYGFEAAEALHNAGCDNIGYFGLPLNNDRIDKTREDGVAEAVEKYGMNYLTEVRDYSVVMSADGAATQVENWLTTYPEMDGIIIGVLTPYSIPGIAQAIKNSGRDVKISVCEAAPDLDVYAKDGQLVWTCGHNVNGATYLAIATLNKLQGTPLADGAIKVVDNVMYMDTIEKMEQFSPHVYEAVYSEDELKNCLQLTNPDFTLDSLNEMSASYCWEWWDSTHD